MPALTFTVDGTPAERAAVSAALSRVPAGLLTAPQGQTWAIRVGLGYAGWRRLTGPIEDWHGQLKDRVAVTDWGRHLTLLRDDPDGSIPFTLAQLLTHELGHVAFRLLPKGERDAWSGDEEAVADGLEQFIDHLDTPAARFWRGTPAARTPPKTNAHV